jgi:hypothetical protein
MHGAGCYWEMAKQDARNSWHWEEVPNALGIEGLARNTVAISATYRLVEGYFTCEPWDQTLRGLSLKCTKCSEKVVSQPTRGGADRGLTGWSRARSWSPFWNVGSKSSWARAWFYCGDAGIGRVVGANAQGHVADETHMRWECRVRVLSNAALFLWLICSTAVAVDAHETLTKLGKLGYALSQYRLPLRNGAFVRTSSFTSIPEDRYPFSICHHSVNAKDPGNHCRDPLELASDNRPLDHRRPALTDPTTLSC